MAPTKTLGALLALLVVATGAAAAMPGNAPVDAPEQADNQTTDAEEEAAQAEMNETAESDEADERGAADEGGEAGGPPADVAGERGPPTDMPGAAPDFVSQIHATIQDHLSGAVENLGSAISEITPGDEAAGDADEEMTQNGQDATETPDSTGEVTDRPAGTPA